MTDASDKILKQAEQHYKVAKDGWQDVLAKAKDDLNFLSDEPYAQWDKQEANNRATVDRPVFEVDQLTQYVHQVANDIRMNTPSIHIIPEGDDTDIETAEALEGRIKAIEYKSNASAAYDMAADFAIKSSLGYIRVDHQYNSKQGFEQELVIKRVVNPASILLDPDLVESDGSDAKFGFAFEDWPVKKFKKKYPDAAAVSFGEENPVKQLNDTDKITIAEYFVIDEQETEYGLMEDGSKEPRIKDKAYKATRKISKPTVNRYLLAGQDVLATTTFPGDYIPIVPVFGEEAWNDGKRHVLSLIRKAKSSAMMYNQLKSSETEILMKQQQAPVQAAVGQMRGFEDDWKKPEKAMVLYYHQSDASGNQAPPPQRLQPPVVSSGFANASLDAENNIKKSLGMYSAAVGNREGDSSGIALKQLDRSSDLATMHFGDNLTRSITQVGKIIVCALPFIEDTARAVQTIGKEEEPKTIGINGHIVEGQDRSFDFAKGDYGVRVVTGAPFTTLRQEAAQSYTDIIKAMPDLMPVIGDLVFKYQDTPGAQAISSRLKKLVDPKLLDESDREKDAPDPQVAQLTMQLQQVTEAAQQQIQGLEAQLQSKQVDDQTKIMDAQSKQQDSETKQGELRLKMMQALMQGGNDNEQSNPQTQPGLDDSPEILQAKLQQKLMERQQQDMKAEQEQQQQEIQQQNEMQMEQAELNLKEVDIRLRQQQADAVIGALNGISQQVSQLTSAAMQPIVIQRDANGNMIGAQ